MRLVVTCRLNQPVTVPINHQDLLQGVIYRLLAASDADYATFLHDRGYAAPHVKGGQTAPFTRFAESQSVATLPPPAESGNGKRFKLFVFSGLRAERRRPLGDLLHLGPGMVRWYISSPVHDFLNHCAKGLLATGAVQVGNVRLPISDVEIISAPSFANGTGTFTCLTPVVAAVPSPDGRPTPRYLRPDDSDAFGEAVRRNLREKHRLVHGFDTPDDRLSLFFNAAYLARARNGGTKKVTFANTDIIGVQAPFTLTAAPELLQLAWECGIGQKNSAGFGMIATEGNQ